MTLKEIQDRLNEINDLAKTAEGQALDDLCKEADELRSKIEDARKRKKLNDTAEDVKSGAETLRPNGESGERNDFSAERGKKLMDGKSVHMDYKNTVSHSTTVLTKHTASDVRPTFNDISSLIDAVKLVELPGGESYERGFEKPMTSNAAYTAEGGNYAEVEPTWDSIKITKNKVTAYCEEPEEIIKLSPAAYDGIVTDSVRKAVRKFLTKKILTGGTSDSVVGIFNAPTKVLSGDCDIEISEIDENTLDEIIFAYGGDEEVESVASLVLTKNDLKAFVKCRKADGNRAYSVTRNGNTGTIDGVPFIINSECKAVSSDSTAAGAFCMAYGPLTNYEFAVFSDLDVSRSTEFKFRQGQIAHKASVFVGGNVAVYNGFVRVKKAKATE